MYGFVNLYICIYKLFESYISNINLRLKKASSLLLFGDAFFFWIVLIINHDRRGLSNKMVYINTQNTTSPLPLETLVG